jgi:hypothetical protein
MEGVRTHGLTASGHAAVEAPNLDEIRSPGG